MGVGRWRNQYGAMPDGKLDMVRVVGYLEGGLQEDPTGTAVKKQSEPGRNVGSTGCGRESKGVCGSLEGPRKVRVRPPEA